jgi:hypothetical protein
MTQPQPDISPQAAFLLGASINPRALMLNALPKKVRNEAYDIAELLYYIGNAIRRLKL